MTWKTQWRFQQEVGVIMSKESFLEDVYQRMKEDGVIDVIGGFFLLLGFWVVLYIIAYFIVFIRGMIL